MTVTKDWIEALIVRGWKISFGAMNLWASRKVPDDKSRLRFIYKSPDNVVYLAEDFNTFPKEVEAWINDNIPMTTAD